MTSLCDRPNAALLVVDIAAVVLLFSPLVGSERSRREQLDQLWLELQTCAWP